MHYGCPNATPFDLWHRAVRLLAHAPAPAEIVATTTMAVLTVAVPRGVDQPAHVHPFHQLCWSPEGTYVLEVDDRLWHLSPAGALWIPAWTAHAFRCAEPLVVLDSKHEPSRCPIAWERPRVVAVGALTAALLQHLADPGIGAGERARAEDVLYDTLRPSAEDRRRALHRPRDPRARTVADAILRDPADDRSLDDWGAIVATSRRTLSRLFREQTALSFTAWRTAARMEIAAARIAGGQSVGTTARTVGYRDTGSFITAFRRAHGTTPGGFDPAAPPPRAGLPAGGRPTMALGTGPGT